MLTFQIKNNLFNFNKINKFAIGISLSNFILWSVSLFNFFSYNSIAYGSIIGLIIYIVFIWKSILSNINNKLFEMTKQINIEYDEGIKYHKEAREAYIKIMNEYEKIIDVSRKMNLYNKDLH